MLYIANQIALLAYCLSLDMRPVLTYVKHRPSSTFAYENTSDDATVQGCLHIPADILPLEPTTTSNLGKKTAMDGYTAVPVIFFIHHIIAWIEVQHLICQLEANGSDNKE